MRFRSARYLTRGVDNTIPIETQIKMWEMIERLPVPADYLQIFRLHGADGVQHITHEQEEPAYSETVSYECAEPVTEKIYVIDDDDHCTMLLAEEY